MASLVDSIIVSDCNRKAMETILGITQPHDKPVNVFIYGPEESGKSAAVYARTYEKDLLSTRRPLTTHPGELVIALTIMLERSEEFLMRVGECDTLFIDAFDDAFTANNIEVAPEAIKLLVGARLANKSKVMDTIVLARKPKAEYTHEDLVGVFDNFEEIEIQPLTDPEDIKKMIQWVIDAKNEKREVKMEFAPEAMAFLASGEVGGNAFIARAVEAIMENAEFENTEVMDLETLKGIFKK